MHHILSQFIIHRFSVNVNPTSFLLPLQWVNYYFFQCSCVKDRTSVCHKYYYMNCDVILQHIFVNRETSLDFCFPVRKNQYNLYNFMRFTTVRKCFDKKKHLKDFHLLKVVVSSCIGENILRRLRFATS